MQVPFNKPGLAGTEIDRIREALVSGKLGGGGGFTRACEAELERALGSGRALLTTSGTDALELAALLLDLGPGDDVVMPSFTFSSTANAFCLRGARPVFVDIRPDTLNLDERLVERSLTSRTRAIVPVHYAGVACEMDHICMLARRHGLRVVEDAAQAIYATYRDRALGTIGDLGCFSFHETKTLISGEGGALIVNDDALRARAEIVREKGTNRAAFFRGEVDKYTWVDIGSSYLPSDVIAAFLFAQLERAPAIIAARRRIFERYLETLGPLAETGHVRLPCVPAQCDITYHMFYLIARDQATRDRLLTHLREHGIFAVFHYVPLHSSPMGRKVCGTTVELPVTDDIAGRILRLPMYNDLTSSEQEYVVEHIYGFYGLKPPVR